MTKAEKAFRAGTKLQPGDAEAAYRFGNALLQQGKVKEARAEHTRSDKLLPDMPETLYSGEGRRCEKAWKKLLELEKEGPLAAQALFQASLYREQGKTGLAAHEMDEYNKLQSTANPPPEGSQKQAVLRAMIYCQILKASLSPASNVGRPWKAR